MTKKGEAPTCIGRDLKYGKVYVESAPPSANESEPLFVLRGQDHLALPTVGQYQVKAIEADVDPVLISALDEVMREFSSFKTENPDQMKLPD